jgi:leucyl aminopeptidase
MFPSHAVSWGLPVPNDLLLPAADKPIPVHLASSSDWLTVKARLPAAMASFADTMGFAGQAGRHLVIANARGHVGAVLLGQEDATHHHRDPFGPGRLSGLLPGGNYVFRGKLADPSAACLSWLLSAYRFERYKAAGLPHARLVVPRGVDAAEITMIAGAVCASRDLVNTPANDLGPDEIEAAIRDLGAANGASVHVTVGDDLLTQNFPMIHAVGKASPRAPRLIDLTWGHASHPKVTLVGKGVVFDTGGLNIKPDGSMLLMKKDMGGAAAAIAAARMVMASKLPVRLRLLVPAVENAISGNAFRPGDVLPSRKGLSVEIGNTDAEGRLILADALALADEERPAFLADFATLTGAARVALGPDLPPFYTHDEKLAADLARFASRVNDPVWRLPLWHPYDTMLDSKIASLNHISGGPFAGSITAALFLNRFVNNAATYVHFDIFAWNPSAKPGRPDGGEVQAARLIHAVLKERYPRH